MVKRASWLLAPAGFMSLAQQAADLIDGGQANQAIVKRYVDELYNRHDVSKIDQILTPGVSAQNDGAGFGSCQCAATL